jgi:nucleotide-binding universal stress UspA family protein
MVAIRRILCPTDFSDFSESALEQAIALGKRYRAEITCLHVVPTLMPPSIGFALPPRSDARARQAALEELGRFAAPARAAGFEPRLEVREASVAPTILEVARSLPADLVVMGTHGLSGFERLMLGSVAEKVLRRAPCPVLTVPQRAAKPSTEPRTAYERILVPLDFADSSLLALRMALYLATDFGSRLTLLHVMEGLPDDRTRDWSHWTVPEYRNALEEYARERLHGVLDTDERKGFCVEEVVTSGKAYAEILRVAEERTASLVVMGTHGASLGNALFGSTAQHVVRASACPVLTVRS